jgi:hypothetical protein
MGGRSLSRGAAFTLQQLIRGQAWRDLCPAALESQFGVRFRRRGDGLCLADRAATGLCGTSLFAACPGPVFRGRATAAATSAAVAFRHRRGTRTRRRDHGRHGDHSRQNHGRQLMRCRMKHASVVRKKKIVLDQSGVKFDTRPHRSDQSDHQMVPDVCRRSLNFLASTAWRWPTRPNFRASTAQTSSCLTTGDNRRRLS